MKYIDLIRKIAWSFHNSTGMEWDELMSEASLAYMEALQSYDPTKATLSTWVYICVRNRLRSFVAQRPDLIELPEGPYTAACPHTSLEFKELVMSLSEDAKIICRTIFEFPKEFLQLPPKLTRGNLFRALRKEGWKAPRIWKSFHEIRQALTETYSTPACQYCEAAPNTKNTAFSDRKQRRRIRQEMQTQAKRVKKV